MSISAEQLTNSYEAQVWAFGEVLKPDNPFDPLTQAGNPVFDGLRKDYLQNGSAAFRMSETYTPYTPGIYANHYAMWATPVADTLAKEMTPPVDAETERDARYTRIAHEFIAAARRAPNDFDPVRDRLWLGGPRQVAAYENDAASYLAAQSEAENHGGNGEASPSAPATQSRGTKDDTPAPPGNVIPFPGRQASGQPDTSGAASQAEIVKNYQPIHTRPRRTRGISQWLRCRDWRTLGIRRKSPPEELVKRAERRETLLSAVLIASTTGENPTVQRAA